MSREDRKHTAFVTVDGLYCYIVMPYGLRNALPTFVRAMNKTFCNLIRDIVEVYVDDIVVKTKIGVNSSGGPDPCLRPIVRHTHEAESREVHFRRLGREAAGFPGLTSRHRGKPSQDRGDEASWLHQGRPEAYWISGRS